MMQLPSVVNSKRAVHLIILGFGEPGRHMAIAAIERSHFRDHRPLYITIVDASADHEQWFHSSYPMADPQEEYVDDRVMGRAAEQERACRIRFERLRLDSPATPAKVANLVKAGPKQADANAEEFITTIALCGPKETTNYSMALELLELLDADYRSNVDESAKCVDPRSWSGDTSFRILIRFFDETGIYALSPKDDSPELVHSEGKRREEVWDPRLFAFGMVEDVGYLELSNNKGPEKAARYVHEISTVASLMYERMPEPKLAWETLSETKRDQNRYVVQTLHEKLRAIGCYLKSEREPFDDEEEVISGIDPEEPASIGTEINWSTHFADDPEENERLIELLAKIEHRRWSAHYFLAGWCRGEKRVPRKRTHDDLAPWDELGEDVRKIHIAIVHASYGIAKRLGMRIVRPKRE